MQYLDNIIKRCIWKDPKDPGQGEVKNPERYYIYLLYLNQNKPLISNC